jgi:tRNA pseudouridine synthase 9
LKGGIHKYLEEIGGEEDCLWKGRNFVFDGRQAASALETKLGRNGGSSNDRTTERRDKNDDQDVVGRCLYCQSPHDTFEPHCVCTVCREPTLVCPKCQQHTAEFHCKQHFHLRTCYFTDLEGFSRDELKKQLEELEKNLVEIAVGRRYKQKRKTLHKQIDKIQARLSELDDIFASMDNGSQAATSTGVAHRCRNCEDPTCSGRCWGFYSLKRKEVLEIKKQAKQEAKDIGSQGTTHSHSIHNRKRNMKERSRDRLREELNHLKLSLPPSAHRDPESGVRVPPPCTKILETKMKGKWNGKPVLQVVKEEFMELAKPGVLQNVLDRGLLRVNGVPVTLENAGAGLKTGDTISRVVHFHEPPVIVPETIDVKKVALPKAALTEYSIPDDCEETVVYVCNKPSSVPVHPAGPYLSNSLTFMVEAQEKLPAQTLIPCHRTDRVTSGLTICCSNTNVARIIQRSMCEHEVQKLYLARVHGRFPSSSEELSSVSIANVSANVSFMDQGNSVKVDAPVETVDSANGIRKVTPQGKPSQSLFRLLAYEPELELSVISCRPITGRSHQLRVHLQLLGFPILNDVLYDGKSLENDDKPTADTATKLLAKSTEAPDDEQKGLLISGNDAIEARGACGLCQSLLEKNPSIDFFTPAQLLQRGHAVDLHAYWYRVKILPKGKKEETPGGGMGKEGLGYLELKVEKPVWADLDDLSDVAWLEETQTQK